MIKFSTRGICTAISLTILLISSARSEDPSSAWTLAQWEQWRDQKIDYLFAPKMMPLPSIQRLVVEREDVIVKSKEIAAGINAILSGDPAYFTRDQTMAKKMGNFTKFVLSQERMSRVDPVSGERNSHLGFSMSDSQYWQDIASTELVFPPLLRSQEFLRLMATPSGYAAASRLIDQRNSMVDEGDRWKYLAFEAQFIKSINDPSPHGDKFGRTYGRMIVLVKEPLTDGGYIHKWILYSLETSLQPLDGKIRPVSMIAVKKNAATDRLKVFFMDFIREQSADATDVQLVPSVLSKGHESKNCYDCHKSAVLAIKPEFEYKFNDNNKMVRNYDPTHEENGLNAEIKKYKKLGVPDWAGLDPRDYGPSIGPDDKPRSAALIAELAPEVVLDDISRLKVANAMKCGECHESFAPLNYLQAIDSDRDVSTAFKWKEGLLATYIRKGWMPPNVDLNEGERKALFLSLSREYFDLRGKKGVFIDWLRGN